MTLSSTAVERAIAQCTSRWAMAREHRLNTSIVLAAVHGLSGLFRAVSAVEPFTLSPPSHSVPVPNRPTRLCGRKATLNQTINCPTQIQAYTHTNTFSLRDFLILFFKVLSRQTYFYRDKRHFVATKMALVAAPASDTHSILFVSETNMTPRDPRWVGAWWLGFLTFGLLGMLSSVPTFFFPRRLKPQPQLRKLEQDRKRASADICAYDLRGESGLSSFFVDLLY